MIDSFLLSVKEKGQKNTTIERINVNWNYSKNNCTRATLSEQARNRRNTVKYKWIPVIDLCEEKWLKYKTFMSRIYRWETMEEIITSLSR